VNPSTTGNLSRSLVAAGAFLPLRAVDEWRAGRDAGLSVGARLRLLGRLALRGTHARVTDGRHTGRTDALLGRPPAETSTWR
jgi:hypothetical protein